MREACPSVSSQIIPPDKRAAAPPAWGTCPTRPVARGAIAIVARTPPRPSASHRFAERCAEKVEEAERLKKEKKCWLKDQLKWQKDREAMQATIDILAAHADVGLAEKLSAAQDKAVRLERELFEANEKILEAQQERLAAMRKEKEVSAATHAANQQSKQFDRGKRQNKCV